MYMKNASKCYGTFRLAKWGILGYYKGAKRKQVKSTRRSSTSCSKGVSPMY